MHMKNLTAEMKARIKAVVNEPVRLCEYNSEWPSIFQEEKAHLIQCLPNEIIRRIEHFGSTAIPGMMAKPIIDILVEVTSLEETRQRVVPVLVKQGYDYFWRPTWGDDQPPFYAWFIKRNNRGKRTHHIHMVEKHFEHWDRLLFRDFLIEKPEVAHFYRELKEQLFRKFPNDRIAYTEAKTDFIRKITDKAKKHYEKN
jgi:GrpB-like predicted nucleotidyltransferase (UPF0157 family)